MRQIKVLAVAGTLMLGACGTTPVAPPRLADEAATRPAAQCVRETGSRIKARAGECLAVAGRVYTNEQMRQTGALNTAEALYRLGL